jgi:hypothetical protein
MGAATGRLWRTLYGPSGLAIKSMGRLCTGLYPAWMLKSEPDLIVEAGFRISHEGHKEPSIQERFGVSLGSGCRGRRLGG